jgi:ribosomal protein S12 methylthiotransferase
MLQRNISNCKNIQRLNKIYKTLVEGVADDGIFYYGRSYAEVPDIDGLIYFTSPKPLNIGEYVDVKILDIEDYDMTGEVTDESAK